MQILDKGILELKSSMGGDLAVVAAARVSNGVDYSDASKGADGDQRLIQYLVKHRHGTPFEHAIFTFYVKCPLFVRSEWHRHRMASYNEISGRYAVYDPEFYFPDRWRIPGATNKQGSTFPDEKWLREWHSTFMEPDPDEYSIPFTLESFDNWQTGSVRSVVKIAYNTYLELLQQGVAKEMARMVLPPNLYTQFYMTVNARGLMNFLSLRTAEDAQWEIRQYAIGMETMFAGLMPLTHRAWVENGRIAP